MFNMELNPYGLFFVNNMDIGEYIRSKRKLHGLTQVELAERSGVGVRFVRELERGKITVQMDKVNQVLLLFGEELRPSRIETPWQRLKYTLTDCSAEYWQRTIMGIISYMTLITWQVPVQNRSYIGLIFTINGRYRQGVPASSGFVY